MKVTHTGINMKGGYSGIYVAQNGYFVYGPKSYTFLRMDAGKPAIIKEEKYPDPEPFDRFMVGFAGGLADVSYVTGVMGYLPAYVVGDAATMGAYENRMITTAAVGTIMSNVNTRSTLARIDKQYAFFFSRDDDRNLSLFQVNKEDGTETAHYKFDDKTPSYEIDYTNGQLYYMNGKMLKIYKLKV